MQTTEMTSEQQTIAQRLAEKIRTKTARVGVVGLGYVGLPLAAEFAGVGFTVTGLDVQDEKCREINNARSYIQDVPTEVVGPLVKAGKLSATTDFSVVADLDTINIPRPCAKRKTRT
jgi:UDP-N-acetyl-D-glucosamine dehydrogenase